MKSASVRTFAALALVLLTRASLAQEQPDSGPAAEAAKRFQAHAKEQAATYEIWAESTEGRKLSLGGEPILRWSNPLGGRNAHGDVFLWTDNGRPAAALSLYEYTDKEGVVHEHHEFCSLATTPLVTQGPGNRDWSPKEGLKFSRMPDAPAPAATATRRLTQMRELAGRFTSEKTTRDNETRDLRLLTQPVLRYESKTHSVTDGALFSLVEVNDPEIFLLVEARAVDGQPQWHYAFARMNSIRLAASLGDQQVFEAETLPWSAALNRTDMSYTAFTVR